MMFWIDNFEREEYAILDLEAAYQVALRQNEDLILYVGSKEYKFPYGMPKEQRLQKYKKVFQETQPP